MNLPVNAVTERKSHNGTVANYYRIPINLNLGVPPNCFTAIYLWVSRDADKPPIKEMSVGAFSPSSISYVTDWANFHAKWSNVLWQNGSYADCNEDAGGSKVYIGYK